MTHGPTCGHPPVTRVPHGSAEARDLAERARTIAGRSPMLWLHTPHVAGAVPWHGRTPSGAFALAVESGSPLALDVAANPHPVPSVAIASELGPAGGPDRLIAEAWLAGWLRAGRPGEFEELTRAIAGPVRGLHITARVPGIVALVLDLGEVLLPAREDPERIRSICVADFALSAPA